MFNWTDALRSPSLSSMRNCKGSEAFVHVTYLCTASPHNSLLWPRTGMRDRPLYFTHVLPFCFVSQTPHNGGSPMSTLPNFATFSEVSLI